MQALVRENVWYSRFLRHVCYFWKQSSKLLFSPELYVACGREDK